MSIIKYLLALSAQTYQKLKQSLCIVDMCLGRMLTFSLRHKPEQSTQFFDILWLVKCIPVVKLIYTDRCCMNNLFSTPFFLSFSLPFPHDIFEIRRNSILKCRFSLKFLTLTWHKPLSYMDYKFSTSFKKCIIFYVRFSGFAGRNSLHVTIANSLPSLTHLY